MDTTSDQTPWYAGWWLLAVALLSACVLTGVFWSGWLPSREKVDTLGQIGDFFGGLLNPLVSTLTLFVAIGVWRLQKKEVEETRKALEEQARTAEQQRQEQRFFDLLNVYQQAVSSIFVAAHKPSTNGEFPVQYTGKEAISQIVRSDGTSELRHFNEHGYGAWTSAFYTVQTREQLIPFWCNETTASLLDHYFRVVFRILSEAETLLTSQHFRYIKLFRAQLSRSELFILAYNIWLDEEGKKMIPMAEKYGLLKHLPRGHLRTTLEQELPAQVFGRTRAGELAAAPSPADTSSHA